MLLALSVSCRMRKAPALILLTTAIGIGLSAIVLFAAMPPVIISAYRGESLSVLNGMIRGQAVTPVDHYLQVWREFSIQILTLEAVVGFVFAGLASRVVQRRVDRLLGLTPGTPLTGPTVRMSGRQRVLANAVVAAVLGVQLFDISMQREDWPFSNYSMYAGQQSERAAWIRVYGVTQTGEVALVPERYLRPFDAVRINYSFGHVLDRADQVSSVRRALQSLNALYEGGRRAGEHQGPALQSLRLYQEAWLIEPPALANKARPNERHLLYELRLTD